MVDDGTHSFRGDEGELDEAIRLFPFRREVVLEESGQRKRVSNLAKSSEGVTDSMLSRPLG